MFKEEYDVIVVGAGIDAFKGYYNNYLTGFSRKVH